MSEDIDTLRAQLAHVAQLLGSPTVSAEAAACIAVKRADELRERAEKAERERDSAHASITAARAVMRQLDHHISEHAWQELESSLNGPNREQEEALARLARYEAPGPALLVAEHSDYCYSVVAPGDDNCSCTKAIIDAAYREQHARCVAVVERVIAEHREHGDGRRRSVAGAILAALTGEAEKARE